MDPDVRAKYAQNGKVMLGSAILLFLVVFVIIFFHIYGHLCLRRRRSHLFLNSISTNFSTAATHFNEGLDPSILKSLPTFTYSSAATHHRSLPECAVCLSEFTDDDEGRMLPGCNHAFHSHCIDTWFCSHSNCPICRAPVRQAAAAAVPLQRPKEPRRRRRPLTRRRAQCQTRSVVKRVGWKRGRRVARLFLPRLRAPGSHWHHH